MSVVDVPALAAPEPPRVTGWCPMGCGRTLVLDPSGLVACTGDGCPRRHAVTELLDDHEVDHVVSLRPGSYHLLHPLRERLDDVLLTCPLQQRMSAMRRPPLAPGVYRAYLSHPDAEIDWDPLPVDGHRSPGAARGVRPTR